MGIAIVMCIVGIIMVMITVMKVTYVGFGIWGVIMVTGITLVVVGGLISDIHREE